MEEINDTRDFLKPNQSIALSVREDGSNPEKYIIRSVIGKGSSAVCYEAVRVRDGQTGKLKEFYPTSAVNDSQMFYYSLKRLQNGQLVPNGGTLRSFRRMCGEYLNTYALLRRVIAESHKNEILKNFIQIGDVLYGSLDSNDNPDVIPTVYIWSPGIAGRGFEDYLNEIRSNPSEAADKRLNCILSALLTLSDCVKSLHTANLLHLDIKPSNFMIPYDSESEINPGSISMFDVNTFYVVGSNAPHTFGTPGFRAPELLKVKPDNQSDVYSSECSNRTDIYSIGAILFNAIVVTPEIPDGIYRDEYYPNIDRLLRSSEFLKNSESGSDVLLMSKLSRILKRCLAKNPEKRYRGCGELKKDIYEAELRSKPHAVDSRVFGGSQSLRVVGNEGISDPTLVIRKLLYDHPLYENLRPDAQQINILTVGSGNLGQKFIDICLQAGQMNGRTLNITAVSDNPTEARKSYLMFRPSISRFVNINGSMNRSRHRNESYGTLNFLPLPQNNSNDEKPCPSAFRSGKAADCENTEIAKKLISEAREKAQPYDYIFVALGKDSLSERVARIFKKIVAEDKAERNCPVCYISEKIKKPSPKDRKAMLFPVCVNEPITSETIDPHLEQLAFNTDISWNSSLNLDITNAFREFCNSQYRYSSSVAFALSIPYKLYSIGIAVGDKLRNPDELHDFTLVKTPLEAAKKFAAQVLDRMDEDPVARSKFDTLSALEHRRWVLDFCAQGWTLPVDSHGKFCLENCIREKVVRNKTKKTHPCLVFSSASSPLSGESYNANHREKWDSTIIDTSLDELDRMSIELHRLFRTKAEEFKANNPLENEDMRMISELLDKSDEEAMRMYKQFVFCLKNILNGVESYTKQYDYYEACFTDSIQSLPEDKLDQIKIRLEIIRKNFFPVIEANLYRNYKENDEILIKKIPFILTYRFREEMSAAFEDGRLQNGRNDAIFANVASATVLSPKRISYLYCFDRDSDEEQIARKLSSIINYLGKRQVHCTITFAAACLTDVDNCRRNGLREILEHLKTDKTSSYGNASFEDYRIFDCVSRDEAAEILSKYLTERKPDFYDGSTSLFPNSVSDSGFFAARIAESGIPYFEFDRKRKIFTKHINCDDLTFLQDGSYIRINDMFALMNATDIRFNLPEFAEDYETLWAIYSGNYLSSPSFEYGVENWNRLCDYLKNYDLKQKPLATLPLPQNGSSPTEITLIFTLPRHTFNSVKRLLEELKEYGAVDSSSTLTSYTSENCRLTLHTYSELEEAFRELFMQEERFVDDRSITAELTLNGSTVLVKRNSLTVTNADIGKNGEAAYSVQLLKKLEEAQFISSLTYNKKQHQVSFKYYAPRIKKLLTTAGEILEIYAYYQVLKTGQFDDVACGYEFCWEDGTVKNELDLVLTKGFRSVIVECKAVQKLDMNFYHKLHSVAEHFGIGTTTILLGNTYKNSNSIIAAANKIQRSRGKYLGIKTISDEEELTDIGNFLRVWSV